MAALRARDPSAAADLWRRYARLVFRVLRHTLGPRTGITDAVQVVLLCVFHRGPRLRPQSDLRRFVLATTVRIAQVELRRHPPRTAPARTAHDPGGDAAPDRVLRLYRILDCLAANDRIAFVLHHVEGLDGRDVAAVMGTSSSRTNARLQRSLRHVFHGIERDPVLSRFRTG